VLEPGTQVGRFRVVRLIAQGGMAEVYRADQEMAPGIFRPAALKVIRPEYSESEDFREMFLDEARTACTLSHPNIVHIYEVGESDGLIYMAMELVPGESLSTVARTLAERGERLPDAALLAIGISTCSALEAVHALELPGEGHVKLVHRDVSPHNLLLSSTGSLKLIDFGIAKAATNRSLTSPGVTKGKAGYFSPEQAMGKLLDGRSDLFSLGVALYKLASGMTPLDGYTTHRDRNQALVAGRWEPLEKVAPGLVPGFYQVVRKALELKPEHRYANAAAMREDLEQVAFEASFNIGPAALAGYVEERNGQVSVLTPPTRVSGSMRITGERPRLPTPPPPTASRVSGKARSLLLRALGAVALVVLGGMGALLFSRGPAAPPLPPPLPVTSKGVPPAEVAPPPLPVPVAEPPVEPLPESKTARPEDTAPTRLGAEGHRNRAAPPLDKGDEAIPSGEGQIRIKSTPPGEVTVNGIRQGETPLNLKLKSGRYRVQLNFPTEQRKKTCEVTVRPDKTSRLVYDVQVDRCAFDFL